MNGILNLNKPAGRTSFDMVSAVKRLCGEKRAGHAGTLDPIARGVLPVFTGKATRLIEYLTEASKTYLAGIEFGASTETYDIEGKVIRKSDIADLKLDRIESALKDFRGEILQTPPVYSALKKQGKPLYRLARAGVSITPESRPVTIHSISLLEWAPPVSTIRVECSKGTYIRSLANDLGEKLGCGAFLRSLVRENYGPFELRDAITIERLEEAVRSGNSGQFFYPADTVIRHWPAVSLTIEETVKVINGIDIPIPASSFELRASSSLDSSSPASNFQLQTSNPYCRAYTADGSFLAVMKLDTSTGLWHPEKVFST